MRIRSVALLAILTLGAGLVGALPAAAAQTLVVDDDGLGTAANCDANVDAYTTIQEAVTDASAGDTIRVCPGTYEEAVTVDKTLEILGAQAGVDARFRPGTLSEESVIIPPESPGAAFYIEAQQVIISGFTFTQWGTAVDSGITNGGGEDPNEAAGLRVLDNIFSGNEVGLAIDSNRSLARRNRFVGGFIGILMSRGSKATFAANDFLNNEVGILLGGFIILQSGSPEAYEGGFGGREDVRILRNDFETSLNGGPQALSLHGTAIEASNTIGLRVIGNTISQLGTGIWLVGGNESTVIEDNDVTEAAFSALLLGSGNFQNSVVYQNGFGGSNSAVTVKRNTLTNSGYGIRLEEGSLSGSMVAAENVISGNGIESPGNGGIVNESAAQVNAASNYWGHPSGPSDWSIGSGDSVSENVRFFPWSLDDAFTTFAQCSNSFTSGNDVVVGTAADEILCGGAGQDNLDGRGGNDLILGGSGSDTLRGGTGDDAILGDQGNDSLAGNAGFDSLQGQAGTDTCVVGVGGGQTATCE